ncbi:MAG: hypothetical protein K6U87_11700 [Firmicutes bacterium]|nr:hypothetical protein [Bacillota bacterium]
MEDKRLHLEFIQGVINRMARNSFLLKGWAVTLVSALLALSAGGGFKRDVIVAYLPLIGFWILDGYFLRQERLFRKLYDAVRVKGDEAIDYSMDTRPYQHEVDSWLKVALSQTLAVFYGTILIAVALVTVFVFVLKP